MSRPPLIAGWLLLFIPAPDREFVAGDLEEEHASRLARFGRPSADAWYRRQVLASLPPLACAAVVKVFSTAFAVLHPPTRNPHMAAPVARASATTGIVPLLIASRPGRTEGRIPTVLASGALHGAVLAGLVWGTAGAGADVAYEEVQVVDVSHELTVAPPPPPPPVEAAVPAAGAVPSLAIPSEIPTEIPPPGPSSISAEEIYRHALDEALRVAPGNPSEAAAPIGATPSFTPYTVGPTMRNRDAVGLALEREYPSLLRDAGIGGRVEVWIRIDDQGAVEDARVRVGSGQPALDEAALRVARIIEFTPAMNRDRAVPVWVSIPITFKVR